MLANCCHRELSWDCEFEQREQASRLAEALRLEGYHLRADHGFVQELTHPDGQTVVIVPRTGRVQLRLPYTTPSEARRALAEQLSRQMSCALAELLRRHEHE